MGKEVLVKPNARNRGGRRVYHKPDPDNPEKPVCNNPTHGTSDYAPKDVDVIPNYGKCKLCYGLCEKKGKSGKRLSTKLSEMDASEVEA